MNDETADLLKAARAIAAGNTFFREGIGTPQTMANNRFAYRAAIALYLLELEKRLRSEGYPTEILAPLLMIADQIEDLENRGLTPPLFDVSGTPFSLSKSPQRLAAEGHAVGCVCYLHEVLNDGLMFACKAVASMFSHLGHKGRIAHRLHEPGQDNPLSWKTLYQWHTEINGPADDTTMSDVLRRAAKQSAFDTLVRKEEENPINGYPTEAFRRELVARIMHIAAKTRVGMPGEPQVTVQRISE